MSEETFVSEESGARKAFSLGLFRLYLRLFRDLPLFMKLLPLSVVFILLASLSPSYFRWYSGNLASGNPEFAVGFAITLVAFATFARISAWAIFEVSGMWSTLELHGKMVRALGQSRTTFFDENPSGRLINRLVRDYDEVRSTAVIFVGDFLNAIVEVFSVAVIAYLAHPAAALLIVPLLLAFFFIQTQRSAMIEHARGFAAVATSQVLGRKHDLIEGREVFLLYGKAGRLLERMGESFREYVSASALTNQVETWASFWMRSSAELFSFAVMLVVVRALSLHWIDAPIAGVIISALIGVTGSIGWLDFATSLISRAAPHVRRVYEYVDLPTEASEERLGFSSQTVKDSNARSPQHAPRIEFVDYSMSYRASSPLILSGLTLDIPAGQKTALIGRTGSGKTSVFQALLRMVYVHSGDIRLDGVSVYASDLRSIRRSFGVVPQSPYLFEGTIRSNLDRVGEYADESLNRALRSVGLERFSLDSAVEETGQNFSLGERQLICLARVIASGKRVILMDEPTSGLDPETDARLSEVLRETLAGTTLITVAHRLESLVHYDRVVELSDGKVVWEGAPRDHRAFRSLRFSNAPLTS